MKKDLTKNERYIINHLKKDNYNVTILKQYNSKIVLLVNDDIIIDEKIEIQSGIENIKSYYNFLLETLELKKEVIRLEKEVLKK